MESLWPEPSMRNQSIPSLPKAEDIARAEMARHRRKLGELTPEQEINIETLLIATANKVSKIIDAIQLSAEFSRINQSHHPPL